MKPFKILLIFICICGISIYCHRKKPAEPLMVKQNDTAKTQQAKKISDNTELTKYGIKSGIIEFVTDIAGTKGSKMLYFDDYGKLEREVFYDGDTPKEAYVTAEGSLYKIIYRQKMAYRLGPAKRGSAYKFDWNAVPESEKKDGHAIKTENINIAGKTCESFKIDNSGVITEFAGWQGICLYAKQQSRVGIAVSRAIKIQENVPVPDIMFEIPKGFGKK